MKEGSIDENKHRRVVNSEMESIVVVSRDGAGGWGLVLIGTEFLQLGKMKRFRRWIVGMAA